MKDNMTDFNGPTFSITNPKQASIERGLMSLGGNKMTLSTKQRQEQFIRREKLQSRTRQTGYSNGMPGSQLSQLQRKRTGGNRGPVAAEFFGQGGNLGDSLDAGDGLKGSQEFFGSSYDMKGGLESQEQGISAEEMFSSPIKISGDMQMDD